MERIIREVPESEYSDEVEELWSPRPSYFARVMDSVAEYGLQVKNEVAEAIHRVKSNPSVRYRSYNNNDDDDAESYSSTRALLSSNESHFKSGKSNYGALSAAHSDSTYDSSEEGGNGDLEEDLSRITNFRPHRPTSSSGSSSSTLSYTSGLNRHKSPITETQSCPIYPTILVNDELQNSSAFTPIGKGFNQHNNSLLKPSSININHLDEQDLKFLRVDTHNGGTASPGGKSSGFLSNESNCPSPAPTMNSSFDLQAPDNNGPEVFTWGRIIKIGILVIVMILIASIITLTSEDVISFKQITVAKDHPVVYPLEFAATLILYYPILTVTVVGSFVPESYQNYTKERLIVYLQRRNPYGQIVESYHHRWEIPIDTKSELGGPVDQKLSHGFDLRTILLNHEDEYSVVITTNTENFFPLAASGRLLSGVINSGVVLGACVMVGLYILIIFELVNRTLAAMLAAAASIGCLAYLNERPTTEEMVSWLDIDTLILLFSMMVIVSLLCETGFFDYCSFMMYKLANGDVWALITWLCIFTAVVSAFLDNVTTILLMTPVTIRICEAMELNPVPVLISIVIFSNIGGACTPVGDPPNVIIANNKEVISAGIDFTQFTLHMTLGILPVVFVAYLQLRIMFRDISSLKFAEPYVIAELRREIDVWKRAADSLSSYSKDENHVRALLMSKILHLKNKLKVKVRLGGQSEENYKANLVELETSCKITNWTLLVKCGCVLTVVIIMFFLHSVPQVNLSMGWTALLGTVLLLILADRRELEGVFSRVEWSTLIFFSALFIVMEGVSRLGLLEWIGSQTEAIILDVNEESRLTVAVLLILWVSGIASAFIDNIPFTTMMIQIVTRISERVHLPLQPLIWALALGTCLGGNGTLIGASANVVCAGVADQHGYKFSFMQYFKIGFPMMIISLLVCTVYLLICHTALQWNN